MLCQHPGPTSTGETTHSTKSLQLHAGQIGSEEGPGRPSCDCWSFNALIWNHGENKLKWWPFLMFRNFPNPNSILCVASAYVHAINSRHPATPNISSWVHLPKENKWCHGHGARLRCVDIKFSTFQFNSSLSGFSSVIGCWGALI
jgi:hypothetical protein